MTSWWRSQSLSAVHLLARLSLGCFCLCLEGAISQGNAAPSGWYHLGCSSSEIVSCLTEVQELKALRARVFVLQAGTVPG